MSIDLQEKSGVLEEAGVSHEITDEQVLAQMSTMTTREKTDDISKKLAQRMVDASRGIICEAFEVGGIPEGKRLAVLADIYAQIREAFLKNFASRTVVSEG